MPPEGSRRRKSPRLFDIVVIPVGEGDKTRTLRASQGRLLLYAAAVLLLCFGSAFIVLVYSSLGNFVPIPNAALERRYGQQIMTLQQQLNGLVQDVTMLKDYNSQLRKALGEGSTGDSATVLGGPSLAVDGASARAERDFPPAVETHDHGAPALDEGSGEIDLGSFGGYGNVVTTSDGGRASFPLLIPVGGMVTQGFDPSRGHYGIDYAGKRGTPVYATADGHVVFSGWTHDDGNMLILAHDGGYMTVYKHNQALLTALQAVVRRGEAIALLGETGRTSSGPHLHFEVWHNGVPRDPDEYLLTPANTQ
ncbi:MAG: M23 family metallopeptidase [Acidobacteria bacterium]|nr:MAG: M23 family metallopeptidase [Acidobacteriota bacterium]